MDDIETIDRDLDHIHTALAFMKTEELKDLIQNAIVDFINESPYEDVLDKKTGQFKLVMT